MKEVLTNAFDDVYNMHKNENVSLRKAAYLVAVKRIADNMMLKGLGIISVRFAFGKINYYIFLKEGECL